MIRQAQITLTQNVMKNYFTYLAKGKTPNAPTCAIKVDKHKCTELD